MIIIRIFSWIIYKNVQILKNTIENIILLIILNFCYSNEFWIRSKISNLSKNIEIYIKLS